MAEHEADPEIMLADKGYDSDAIRDDAYSDDAARVFQPSSAHRSNLMAPTIPI